MLRRSRRSIFCSLSVLFFSVLVSCQTTPPVQQSSNPNPQPSVDIGDTHRVEAPQISSPRRAHFRRTFFHDMLYTMGDHRVRSGMLRLESLFHGRFPESMLVDDPGGGERVVPEVYLMALYSEASQGDQHVTYQEFEAFRQAFLGEIEGSGPDIFRILRRGR